MINPFPFSSDNKRYYTWNYYLRTQFHEKLIKIALDGGFSCPNRDGTCGVGGCIFCSEQGSGEFTQSRSLDLIAQYEAGKQQYQAKWPKCRGIAYFQNFTNTHGSIAKLKECFEPFLKLDDCAGISIGTRADALDDAKITYLQSLSEHKPVWIELGLQSTYDETAKLMNRGHSYQTFLNIINKLKDTDLKVVVHLINGLPGETYEQMLNNAERVGKLPIHGLKLHMLHILKNTRLAELYEQTPFPIMSRNAYISLVVDQLERIPSSIVIQRLTGDGRACDLIAPVWTTDKKKVLNGIDQELTRRNSWQGKYLQK